jgi:HD-GYP domain-containing protein (c-di-GMP phosphodiesterase class II)
MTKRINLDKGLLKSLMVFGAVIEARDAYTGGHTWRVAWFAKKLAERAGLSKQGAFLAALGGFVHDIGKVGVPDSILNKPSALTAEEYAIMQSHPATGKMILAEHPLAPLVLDAVCYHHERVDGKGYPGAVGGEQQSVISRIIAISDAFDAMTSTRSYRAAMKKEKAIALLREQRGLQFDAALVDCFARLAQTAGLDWIIGHSDESRPLLHCPVCGPIVAVPGGKQDGDAIYCHACKGKFELHIKGDTFDLEFKNERDLSVRPEIDLQQIGKIGDILGSGL